jgi:hypothetical protein
MSGFDTPPVILAETQPYKLVIYQAGNDRILTHYQLTPSLVALEVQHNLVLCPGILRLTLRTAYYLCRESWQRAL